MGLAERTEADSGRDIEEDEVIERWKREEGKRGRGEEGK